MSNRKWRIQAVTRPLLALVVSVALLAPGVSITGASPALQEVSRVGGPPLAAVQVNGDLAQTGDMIAAAQLGSDGNCAFNAPIRIRTTALGAGITKWVVVRVDDQCRLIVLAKWTGAVTQGPPSLVQPLQEQLASLRTTPSTSSTQATGATALLNSKTSHQFVYTYGGGGPGPDKLTSIESQITFTWDGTNATLTSGGQSCGGADPSTNWRWMVDGCGIDYQDAGPRDVVWRTSVGHFHCEPPNASACTLSDPDGYYHSLYASEDGHGNGVSHCDFWHTGNIVFGPNRDIWQGCS